MDCAANNHLGVWSASSQRQRTLGLSKTSGSSISHTASNDLTLILSPYFRDDFCIDLQPLNVEREFHFACSAKSTLYRRATAIAQRSSAIVPAAWIGHLSFVRPWHSDGQSTPRPYNVLSGTFLDPEPSQLSAWSTNAITHAPKNPGWLVSLVYRSLSSGIDVTDRICSQDASP